VTDERKAEALVGELKEMIEHLEERVVELEQWQAVQYAALAIVRWFIAIVIPVAVTVLAYYLGANGG
jgi:hypothetical protein